MKQRFLQNILATTALISAISAPIAYADPVEIDANVDITSDDHNDAAMAFDSDGNIAARITEEVGFAADGDTPAIDLRRGNVEIKVENKLTVTGEQAIAKDSKLIYDVVRGQGLRFEGEKTTGEGSSEVLLAEGSVLDMESGSYQIDVRPREDGQGIVYLKGGVVRGSLGVDASGESGDVVRLKEIHVGKAGEKSEMAAEMFAEKVVVSAGNNRGAENTLSGIVHTDLIEVEDGSAVGITSKKAESIGDISIGERGYVALQPVESTAVGKDKQISLGAASQLYVNMAQQDDLVSYSVQAKDDSKTATLVVVKGVVGEEIGSEAMPLGTVRVANDGGADEAGVAFKKPVYTNTFQVHNNKSVVESSLNSGETKVEGGELVFAGEESRVTGEVFVDATDDKAGLVEFRGVQDGFGEDVDITLGESKGDDGVYKAQAVVDMGEKERVFAAKIQASGDGEGTVVIGQGTISSDIGEEVAALEEVRLVESKVKNVYASRVSVLGASEVSGQLSAENTEVASGGELLFKDEEAALKGSAAVQQGGRIVFQGTKEDALAGQLVIGTEVVDDDASVATAASGASSHKGIDGGVEAVDADSGVYSASSLSSAVNPSEARFENVSSGFGEGGTVVLQKGAKAFIDVADQEGEKVGRFLAGFEVAGDAGSAVEIHLAQGEINFNLGTEAAPVGLVTLGKESGSGATTQSVYARAIIAAKGKSSVKGVAQGENFVVEKGAELKFDGEGSRLAGDIQVGGKVIFDNVAAPGEVNVSEVLLQGKDAHIEIVQQDAEYNVQTTNNGEGRFTLRDVGYDGVELKTTVGSEKRGLKRAEFYNASIPNDKKVYADNVIANGLTLEGSVSGNVEVPEGEAMDVAGDRAVIGGHVAVSGSAKFSNVRGSLFGAKEAQVVVAPKGRVLIQNGPFTAQVKGSGEVLLRTADMKKPIGEEGHRLAKVEIVNSEVVKAVHAKSVTLGSAHRFDHHVVYNVDKTEGHNLQFRDVDFMSSDNNELDFSGVDTVTVAGKATFKNNTKFDNLVAGELDVNTQIVTIDGDLNPDAVISIAAKSKSDAGQLVFDATSVDLDNFNFVKFDPNGFDIQDEGVVVMKGKGDASLSSDDKLLVKGAKGKYKPAHEVDSAIRYELDAEGEELKVKEIILPLDQFVAKEQVSPKAAAFARSLSSHIKDKDASMSKDISNTLARGLSQKDAASTIRSLTPNSNSNMGSRLSAKGAMKAVNNRLAAISAGGDAMEMGAWAQGLYSSASQKARKGEDGFDVYSFGGALGYDVRFENGHVLGVSAAYSTASLKYKDSAEGDKVKSRDWNIGAYYMHELGKHLFFTESINVGFDNSKITRNKTIGGSSEIATGKYDGMSIGASALAGYKFKLGKATTLSPIVGLSWNRFIDEAYTEKSKSFSEKIGKKTTDVAEVNLGARLSHFTSLEDIQLTSEVHAFANYDFLNKAEKVSVSFEGDSAKYSLNSSKSAKLEYNLGASLGLKHENVECSFAYDLDLKHKYVGHRGSIKARVNF